MLDQQTVTQALQYTVTQDGLIIAVKTTEGSKTQSIKATKQADGLPWATSYRSGGRFDNLKRAVIRQEIGYWYTYEGFVSEVEVKYAQSAINRYYKDQLMKYAMKGKKLTTCTDAEGLRLGVMVVIAEVKVKGE